MFCDEVHTERNEVIAIYRLCRNFYLVVQSWTVKFSQNTKISCTISLVVAPFSFPGKRQRKEQNHWNKKETLISFYSASLLLGREKHSGRLQKPLLDNPAVQPEVAKVRPHITSALPLIADISVLLRHLKEPSLSPFEHVKASSNCPADFQSQFWHVLVKNAQRGRSYVKKWKLTEGHEH